MTEKNTLFLDLVGEICEQNIKPLIQAINGAEQNQSPGSIELTLDSTGGFFYSTVALHDLIKRSERTIDIVATGTCQSSAVAVLQAGRRRLSMEHTLFMCHSPRFSIADMKSIEELELQLAEYRREWDVMDEMIIARSKLSLSEYRTLTKETRFFTANEALAYGLIDTIV